MVTIIYISGFLLTLCSARRPNIVFILADDLGWNDVGFHGSNQIPTPNIDALAYTGIILNNYYVLPSCTPSRSALMTGKYPIHTGMQGRVILPAEPRGLPLSETLLPQYLKKNGYSTKAVGKWHLGHWKAEYTPTKRGFDSHFGLWGGAHDCYDHTLAARGMWGLDMRRNMEIAYDVHGNYSTKLFADESVKIINEHNINIPLFLYVATTAVHQGNFYNRICTLDSDASLFTNITDYNRRRYAGVVKGLDDAVGSIVEALRKNDMLHNTIIVFSTDNGGSVAGLEDNAGSNWPLRGAKKTLWEGGMKGASFIWSPVFKNPRVSNQLFHITDWLPTLLCAAKIETHLSSIDGIDMWDSFVNNEKSKRNEILHNIDDIEGTASLQVDNWKLIIGSSLGGIADDWYGPTGRENVYKYSSELVLKSQAGKAVKSLGLHLNDEIIHNMRKNSEIFCNAINSTCESLVEPCLFNIQDDPCEYNNVASYYPSILKYLQEKIIIYNNTAVPPNNLPLAPQANPIYWNNVWNNFGDYDSPINNYSKTSCNIDVIHERCVLKEEIQQETCSAELEFEKYSKDDSMEKGN